jgi:flagellar FliL protein
MSALELGLLGDPQPLKQHAMADDQDPPEQEEDVEEAPRPRRRVPLMLFIGIGLAVGAAAGVFFAGPLLAKKLTSAQTPGAAATEPKEGAKADGKGDGKQGVKESDVPVWLVDNLVLNPAGSGGTRFLLASIGIQMGTAAQLESLKKHDLEVREVVLQVLGARKVEELTEIGNREVFKEKILAELNKILGSGSVKGMYFSQFVIQ